MSLVVNFQGQFRPYEPTVNESLRTKRLSRIAPVFEDVLHQVLDQAERDIKNQQTSSKFKQNKAAISNYQKGSQSLKRRYFARDIMTENLETLSPDETLNNALALMHKKKFHHLPIVNEQKVVGIVSDRLLISSLAQGKALETSLQDIMIQETICGTPNTTIADIARCMLSEDISCLPITDDKFHLKGIVTKSDLLTLLILSFPLDIYS